MTKGRIRRLTRAMAYILFALALFALAGYGVSRANRWRRERPMLGRLSHVKTLDHAQRFSVGSFVVDWAPGVDTSLVVTHEDMPDKIVWASLPGRAFVNAARGQERITEHRGMFFIRDRLNQSYPHQHIEKIEVLSGTLHITGRLFSRFFAKSVPYVFIFEERAPNHLGFTFEVDGKGVNRSYLTYASDPDEGFFGFGAQFTHFNLKGRRVPILVMEQGIGRGRQPLTFLVDLVARAGGAWHTSYALAPHYITSHMRSLFLETHAYAVFDLRTPNRAQISLFASRMTGRILAGDTPTALIGEYTAAVGRMRPLPDWILEGAVVGMQGGTEKARRVWRALEEHQTPVAAFWLQDWVGQRTTIVGKQLWWNWELDRNHYPDWEELIALWARDGVRVMTYVNPFLIDPSAKDNYERNLFREALDKGYLIRRESGEAYLIKNTDFSAAMIDLANPEAWAWMKALLHDQVIGVGASGWMADFGEALPWDALLHGDVPAAEYHNRYPEAWAQLNREVIEETGRGDEFVFFMRSGYRESPRHATLFWLGDQMTTWDRHDGMKSAVTGLLSSGLSGFAFNHSDIGGYTAVVTPVFSYRRDRELLMRWMEMNAFSVVFRTHEGIAPDANHQFYSDQESLAHFSRCARMYKAWAPYRKELVREASETGLPVVRHPFIHYPRDPRVKDLVYEQFLVGDCLMVAPVLGPGEDQVVCYLPGGDWTHLWSGQRYEPGEQGMDVTVAAPLGEPAVFYRTGAPEALAFVDSLKRLDVVN